MVNNPYAAPNVDPTAPARGQANNGPRDWTIGHAIGVGWEATKSNPLPLIGGYFLVLVINQVVQGTIQTALGLGAAKSGDPMVVLTGVAAFMPIAVVLGTYFAIGQFRVALDAARGEAFQFARFFSGFDRLLPGILASIVMYLGFAVGLIFFIIPGVIIMLGWSMVLFLIADTKGGTMEMLSESWNATKGQRLNIFLFYFACLGVALLGLLALGIGILVALPVIMIAMAEVYMCVTGRRTAEA